MKNEVCMCFTYGFHLFTTYFNFLYTLIGKKKKIPFKLNSLFFLIFPFSFISLSILCSPPSLTYRLAQIIWTHTYTMMGINSLNHSHYNSDTQSPLQPHLTIFTLSHVYSLSLSFSVSLSHTHSHSHSLFLCLPTPFPSSFNHQSISLSLQWSTAMNRVKQETKLTLSGSTPGILNPCVEFERAFSIFFFFFFLSW